MEPSVHSCFAVSEAKPQQEIDYCSLAFILLYVCVGGGMGVVALSQRTVTTERL